MAPSVDLLHPDLVPYIVTTAVGQMVQHPLVHTLYFGSAQEAEWINAAYEQKTTSLNEALERRDWDHAIVLVERPYRVDVLARVPRDAPGYWKMVAAWWADTEFPHHRIETWLEILDHPDAHHMMAPSDREVYDALPEVVTVHRGIGPEGTADGLSWTLSHEKAVWFAQRFASTTSTSGEVVTREVAKERITAYLDRRSEQEVIVLPKHW